MNDQSRTMSLEEALKFGAELLQQGRLQEADAIFTAILKKDEHQPEALYLKAQGCVQGEDLDQGIELLQRAIGEYPQFEAAQNDLGNLFMMKGLLFEAKNCYQKVLDLNQNNAGAMSNLAGIYQRMGDHEESLSCYQSALELGVSGPIVHFNMGVLFSDQNDWERAIDSFEAALKIDPANQQILESYGSALEAAGKIRESSDARTKSLESQAANVQKYIDRGEASLKSGLRHDALSAFQQALEIDSNNLVALAQASSLLHRCSRIDEAKALVERWVELDPESPFVGHAMASLGMVSLPDKAEDAYVEALFDGYANDFDRSLAELEYQGPRILVDALLRAEILSEKVPLSILDAGCGTGLAGPLLKPFASLIHGVDLSQKMLEKCEKTCLYDELVYSEITQFLSEEKALYDLIVSIDTLIYFGDLQPVLTAAYKRLNDGGCLAFTLELCEDQPESGYRMMVSGRYAHTQDFVETLCVEAGFSLKTVQSTSTRMESSIPVPGLVVILVKN